MELTIFNIAIIIGVLFVGAGVGFVVRKRVFEGAVASAREAAKRRDRRGGEEG